MSSSNRKELLDAQTHIYNHMFSYANSMSLKCAIELGVPDAIHNHGNPMTLSELADALPINEAKSDSLYHLMRILVHSKFFDKVQISKDGDEAYSLTRASRLLLRDAPMNASSMVLHVSDPIIMAPWHHMSRWFQNDDSTSFVTAHGRTLWEHAAVDQRHNKSFNEAMATDSWLVNGILVEECKHVFEGLRSIVDVGGGTGETAKGFADAFPGLRCIVLDLPHVVDGLEGSMNLSFVGGDMLEFIPHGDAVFIKWMLHSLCDEDCVKVLKNCKKATAENKGRKVIVVEIVVEDQKDDRTATETQLFFDMQMMVEVGGKERTEKEWAHIFYDAGFGDYKITRVLGLRTELRAVTRGGDSEGAFSRIGSTNSTRDGSFIEALLEFTESGKQKVHQTLHSE